MWVGGMTRVRRRVREAPTHLESRREGVGGGPDGPRVERRQGVYLRGEGGRAKTAPGLAAMRCKPGREGHPARSRRARARPKSRRAAPDGWRPLVGCMGATCTCTPAQRALRARCGQAVRLRLGARASSESTPSMGGARVARGWAASGWAAWPARVRPRGCAQNLRRVAREISHKVGISCVGRAGTAGRT